MVTCLSSCVLWHSLFMDFVLDFAQLIFSLFSTTSLQLSFYFWQGSYQVAKWNGTKVSVKILDKDSYSDPETMYVVNVFSVNLLFHAHRPLCSLIGKYSSILTSASNHVAWSSVTSKLWHDTLIWLLNSRYRFGRCFIQLRLVFTCWNRLFSSLSLGWHFMYPVWTYFLCLYTKPRLLILTLRLIVWRNLAKKTRKSFLVLVNKQLSSKRNQDILEYFHVWLSRLFH